MPLDRHALQQADWAAAFPEAVLARGRSCAKQGLVRILRVTAETIEARCHGGAERPYRQDIRLSPQQQHMPAIIAAFDAARRGEAVTPDTAGWNASGLVDGYWFGDAGIAQRHTQALAQIGA